MIFCTKCGRDLFRCGHGRWWCRRCEGAIGCHECHPPRPLCVHCGERIERKDDGEWWHPTQYSGYMRCRLRAEPPFVAEVTA